MYGIEYNREQKFNMNNDYERCKHEIAVVNLI